jgi:uncharacterized membrane protein
MEEKSSQIMKTNTLAIVQVALMIALTTVVTMTVRIPTYAGYTHLGDSMIFLAVILFGKKKAVVSAGIGMCLADILSGYLVWAPFTLVIKGSMALIAGIIAYRGKYNGDNMMNNVFAFIIAGIWMIIAYYFAGAIITRFVLAQNVTFAQSLVLSLKDIPANFVEVAVGIILAIPLGKMIKKSGFRI